MKKQRRVRRFKNDPAEIISVSTAVLGRMHREVIFTRHSIAIIIHFSLETQKKIKRTTDTYRCYPFLGFGPTSRVPGCAIGTEIHYLFLEVVPNFTTRDSCIDFVKLFVIFDTLAAVMIEVVNGHF